MASKARLRSDNAFITTTIDFLTSFEVGEAIRRNMDKECYNKCNKDYAHQAFGHPTFPTQLVMCSTPLSPLYIICVFRIRFLAFKKKKKSATWIVCLKERGPIDHDCKEHFECFSFLFFYYYYYFIGSINGFN
jgi:hypothetical protein